MKTMLQSKYLIPSFLFFLFIINLIQGYATELIADEAYYWAYSNDLDWGYFDHPPMVAIWITISNFFISSGELSVRFFSSITLSLSFYFVWLTIKHSQKNNYTWLFIILIASTSLFNAYGFITVPDTPLMFFTSLFLLGYRKYIDSKSFWSYCILTLAMTGMLYSKYQGVLVIFFVLLSNIKVLKDGKIWLVTLCTILLFSPHLYWQISNDFPSFKYHLIERASNSYKIGNTANHFLNLIAIIGFTFPIVYLAFIKRFKTKNIFEKGLRYMVLGFAIFFFISSFKNHVQAQWIVPISIPLIIIPFKFLIDNPKHLKVFKILASITIIFTVLLRFVMTNDTILPKKFEMHSNKQWVNKLNQKIKERTPLFINSYQNTSLYWFYSGNRPFQMNTWWSRKNQYDLYNFNKNYAIKNPVLVKLNYNSQTTDSIIQKNDRKIYIKEVNTFYDKLHTSFITLPKSIVINKNDTKSSFPVVINNNTSTEINSFLFKVVLRSNEKRRWHNASLNDGVITFTPNLKDEFKPTHIQIIGTSNKHIPYVRLSEVIPITYNE